MQQAGRVLALDFGLRQIGLAVGERASGAVQPLGSLKAKGGGILWPQLDSAVAEWEPDLLLVGLPLHMDGRSGTMAERAREFADSLKARYGLPCAMSDERLSTRTAREHWDGKDREQLQSLSAAVILSDWLGRQSAGD